VTTPIRELEVWAAWCQEAARLELHAGDRLDFDALLVGVRIPLASRALDAILVERTRLARLRRPAYRLEDLAIVADPLGLADNLAGVVDELRQQRRDAHRLAILEDVARQVAAGRTEEAAARSWNAAVRTLRRWRAETGQNRRPMSAGRPKTGRTVVASRSTSSRSGRFIARQEVA
jgi:hypothetical protein